MAPPMAPEAPVTSAILLVRSNIPAASERFCEGFDVGGRIERRGSQILVDPFDHAGQYLVAAGFHGRRDTERSEARDTFAPADPRGDLFGEKPPDRVRLGHFGRGDIGGHGDHPPWRGTTRTTGMDAALIAGWASSVRTSSDSGPSPISRVRRCDSASSTSSNASRAGAKASATALPMPMAWLPCPGKINALTIAS